jgi:N-acetylgalactosamine-N,N'-diacetylbacillosaminyl-diphospho-undecaprenol 4-alpha-N-acetylgalactosaminyltransferase
MIALLINSLGGGGAEKVGLTLLKEFRRQGMNVTLIVLEKEANYLPPEDVEVIYLTDFQKLTHPLIKLFWVFISAYRLSRIVRKRQLKLVQSHLIRANFINISSRFFGARHYVQVITHGQMFFKEAPLIRKLKKMFYRWLYEKADEVISISEMMKEKMNNELRLHHLKEKHRVIYNPHAIAQIQSLSEEPTPKFHFHPAMKYLISAGRLYQGKRIDDIIKALVAVRRFREDVELVILGNGIGLESFQEEAKNMGVAPYVHFLGYCENPFAYLARADLFILASESEGLPNIIIESMACGTAVISSDCISGPREILSPGTDFRHQIKSRLEYAPYGVLFPVGRSDLLAEAILKLLSKEELRDRYVAAGLRRAATFDKSVIIEQYFNRFKPHTIKKASIKERIYED